MIATKPDISLEHAVELLRKGEVVAFPTETVYGLGADAWNADAVARIFELKGRPADNPLIVHVSSPEMADTLAAEVSEDASKLMEQFWPGPLTIIFPKRQEVLDIVTAGIPTVAVRMPNHPIPLRLISEAGPIAAPSANTSGRPSPTRSEHVRQDFGNDVTIIEGGSCQYGLESTVLDLTQKPYTILRPGHITQSELEKALHQPVRVMTYQQEADFNQAHGETSPRSPGMKYTHYAPDAHIRWMDDEEPEIPRSGTGKTLYLLHHISPEPGIDERIVRSREDDGERIIQSSGNDDKRIIHYRGNYTEMARDLYDRFRMADLKGYSEVAIEPFRGREEATEALINRIRKAIGS